MQNTIIAWMHKYAEGTRNAKTRKIISSCLQINDAELQRAMSQIPQIISSSSDGYYILENDPKPEEIYAAKQKIEEHRSRIISLYKRYRKQRQYINSLKNKQGVLL